MSELSIKDVSAHGGGGCGCGGHDEDVPVLDVRIIPHAIRHGSVNGAFSQLRPGMTMHIIAPHNPKPLLQQLVDLNGADAIEISYVSEEPWTIALKRK
ncbi:MAG: DUF2249 domain-containing protein [Flaviflexus sp.]|uniref:DUF2249 domain-containing protein n=1 Tax=Flaviflexus sp. TaxID=1969482 RepID=UPI003F8EB375